MQPLPCCRTFPSPQKEGHPHQQALLIPPPQPVVTSDYCLPVVGPFWMFPISGSIQGVLHCVWLPSLRRVFSGFAFWFAFDFCMSRIISVGVYTQKVYSWEFLLLPTVLCPWGRVVRPVALETRYFLWHQSTKRCVPPKNHLELFVLFLDLLSLLLWFDRIWLIFCSFLQTLILRNHDIRSDTVNHDKILVANKHLITKYFFLFYIR